MQVRAREMMHSTQTVIDLKFSWHAHTKFLICLTINVVSTVSVENPMSISLAECTKIYQLRVTQYQGYGAILYIFPCLTPKQVLLITPALINI